MPALATAYARALIQRGAEFAVAEDKAFMGNDEKAEMAAMGAKNAIVWALAEYLGMDTADVEPMILAAVPE